MRSDLANRLQEALEKDSELQRAWGRIARTGAWYAKPYIDIARRLVEVTGLRDRDCIVAALECWPGRCKYWEVRTNQECVLREVLQDEFDRPRLSAPEPPPAAPTPAPAPAAPQRVQTPLEPSQTRPRMPQPAYISGWARVPAAYVQSLDALRYAGDDLSEEDERKRRAARRNRRKACLLSDLVAPQIWLQARNPIHLPHDLLQDHLNAHGINWRARLSAICSQTSNLLPFAMRMPTQWTEHQSRDEDRRRADEQKASEKGTKPKPILSRSNVYLFALPAEVYEQYRAFGDEYQEVYHRNRELTPEQASKRMHRYRSDHALIVASNRLNRSQEAVLRWLWDQTTFDSYKSNGWIESRKPTEGNPDRPREYTEVFCPLLTEPMACALGDSRKWHTPESGWSLSHVQSLPGVDADHALRDLQRACEVTGGKLLAQDRDGRWIDPSNQPGLKLFPFLGLKLNDLAYVTGEPIHTRLKPTRLQRDLTQLQAAQEYGVSESTWRKWETGRMPIPIEHHVPLEEWICVR